MAIDLKLLKAIHRKMAGRVKYRLGAKAPKLGGDSNDVTHIDCSGHTRFLLYRASGGKVKLPDGSWNQRAYAERNFREVEYMDAVRYAGRDPSRLFIAFITPGQGNLWPRHVWLMCSNGKKQVSMESASSIGVGSRPWDHRTLMQCNACFEIEL